jgi:acyl dehydratase
VQLTLAEIEAAQDLDLGVSAPFTVDQERIDRFADATDDHQWIHVDASRAAAGPFGATIAHGFLTLSLMPRMLFDLVQFPDAGMIVNYGLDKVRFLTPVPAGTELRLRARLLSGTERAGGVLFRVRGDLLLGADGRRAAVAELLFLAQRPPGD